MCQIAIAIVLIGLMVWLFIESGHDDLPPDAWNH